MEENHLNFTQRTFHALFQNGNRYLFPDSEYTTISAHFQEHRQNFGVDNVHLLYNYLKGKGHFQQAQEDSIIASLERVLDFVSKHPDPYNWRITDADYTENLLGLYHEIKNIAQFRQQKQIVVITLILSVIYGCCPTFDSHLCALLHITPNATDLTEFHIRSYLTWKEVLMAVIVVSSFSIQNMDSPNGVDTRAIREHISEMAHGLHYALEEEERIEEALNPFVENGDGGNDYGRY